MTSVTKENLIPLARILVLDDEEQMCLSLKSLLEKEGYLVDTATSARQAFSLIIEHVYQLIISDIRMPEMGGLTFLSKIGTKVPVIMITAHASIETARKAFKLGASDYLAKPFKFEELLVIVHQFAKSSPRVRVTDDFTFMLTSESPEYCNVLNLAKRFSETDLPILITGESGTGKEVIADYIYHFNKHKVKPESYVKINCAAIPSDLLEGELFGYEKGSFTGATTTRTGKIEAADGGILLLDEIGDMPLILQAKILRVVQDLKVYHIGSNKPISVNTRLIAASNQDLESLVEQGAFRLDLYHRLKGVHLKLPALRDRKIDIKNLSEYFLHQYNIKYHKQIGQISREVQQVFQLYSWPGNIRELKYCIERAVVVCESNELLLENLPETVTADTTEEMEATHTKPNEAYSNTIDLYRNEYMRKIILQALDRTNGNKQEAAKLLNISRQTLYNRMKELEIQNEFK